MTSARQTVLITGANSLLSRAVIESLHETVAFRAIDRHFTAAFPDTVVAVEGDIRDVAFVQSQMEGVDTLIHFAPIAPLPGSDTEAIDLATRGTYVPVTVALDAGVKRIVLGSTLDLFDRFPAALRITETWRPRPTSDLNQLAPWLAELSVRECVRTTDVSAVCLRFGRVVDATTAATAPYDPRWLHLDDAVAGVRCALEFVAAAPFSRGWSIYHITAAGDRTKIRAAHAIAHRHDVQFGYEPLHDFRERWTPTLAAPKLRWQDYLAPSDPVGSRKIQRVVFFGSGGPVAAATADEMADAYTLRLTDIHSLADLFAAGKRQSKGAPLPYPLPPPHEDRVVDVRDAAQVDAACEGMDAIVNCSVLRPHPVEAFRVNTLGAYHIAKAAVRHRIRRVVQTGPALTLFHSVADYPWDYDLTGDAPPRPHRDLYSHSKYLGQEILRVFADAHDLEVPVLLYCQFTNPDYLGDWVHPLAVSWNDSARALRCAVETDALQSRYEVFHIGTDLPHGVYDHTKEAAQLGWRPQDDLSVGWYREDPLDR